MQVGYIIKTTQENENVNNPTKKAHKYRLVSHYQGKKLLTNQSKPKLGKQGIVGSTLKKKSKIL